MTDRWSVATRPELQGLKRRLKRLWILSPERLWLLSIELNKRGYWAPAFLVKQLNTILYHNSLATGATVSPDVELGHYGHGIVVSNHITIGRAVKIWQNAALLAGRPARTENGGPPGARGRIIIEDGATIGSNAVLISPRGQVLRIGRGARVGAGAVVTQDVPPFAVAVSPPVTLILREDGQGDVPEDAGAEPSNETST